MPESSNTTTDAPQEYEEPQNNTTVMEFSRKNRKHLIGTDPNCQNTRNEILIRDSKTPVKFKTKKDCKVESEE